MPAPILALQSIRLRLGSALLLDGAELSVLTGDHIALVGRNGAGKSTLLRIAAGEIAPDAGTRFLQPGATLRYLPQEPDLAGFATTLAYVEAGLTEGDDPYRARYLLDSLGLTGQEPPQTLSGGQARRAALARVLAPEPDILLLDEPTNHLDVDAVEWLEAELSASRSALVLISHDRRFLSTLSRATVWLDRGATRRLDEGFAGFEDWRDRLLEEEERERARLGKRITREEHWLARGVTARRKRNMGRLARLHELRRNFAEQRRVLGTAALKAGEAGRSGAIVIDADRISKRYGDRPVIRDLTLRVQRGARLGLVGPNGAGKTTLIRLLTGALAPDSGAVRLGTGLEIASLDQGRAGLDPAQSLKDALTGGGGDQVMVHGTPRHVFGYMQDMLFLPEQAGTSVGKLSGGERARLALARALALPSNLFVLDEPTNDLDLETLDLLEELLADYPGTVIVATHDRQLLDKVATSVLVAEGHGRWVEYAGGYTDMLAQRGPGRPAQAPARRERPAATPPATRGGTDRRPRKLSFNEKHALETLPAEIERLRTEIGRLNARLADPGLYARDPAGFAEATAALAKAQAELEAAEDRWLALEILREEIEGSA